ELYVPSKEPVAEGHGTTPAALLVLSAASPPALLARAHSMSAWLREWHDFTLHDLCYTASVRRTHHEHRLAVLGRSQQELAESLESLEHHACAGVFQGEVKPGIHP